MDELSVFTTNCFSQLSAADVFLYNKQVKAEIFMSSKVLDSVKNGIVCLKHTMNTYSNLNNKIKHDVKLENKKMAVTKFTYTGKSISLYFSITVTLK